MYYMRSCVARAARESDEIWTEMTSFSCIYDLTITHVHSRKSANIITGFVAVDNYVSSDLCFVCIFKFFDKTRTKMSKF